MERADWEFINTFAPWLSALGTLAAVAVALYLARRDRRVRLTVTADLARSLADDAAADKGAGSPVALDPDESVMLTVTNLGYRSVTVGELFWQTGRTKKQYYFHLPEAGAYSGSLPAKLSEGDQALFTMPLSRWDLSLEVWYLEAPETFDSRALRGLRVGVRTSTGETFTAGVSRRLGAYTLEKVEEIERQHRTTSR